jgi:arylsulfatase
VRWPAKIKPDPTPRPQFHHSNDLVPTIYEILGITPPREVDGVLQDPIDGVSFAYSFGDPKAKGRLLTQYFEIMGSRAIYHDGWMASAIGPRLPLAAQMKVLPIGGGLWVGLHPELRVAPPYAEWTFPGDMVRMPESCAPALGNKPNVVVIDVDVPPNANGVLYKLGANAGGLTLFVEDGILCYEYNLFIIQRTQIRSKKRLPAGKVQIEVKTVYEIPRQAGPLKITLSVNGETFGEGRIPVSAALGFTANDCLDIGMALGSPVSLDYRNKTPFKFNGKIHQVNVRYLLQN